MYSVSEILVNVKLNAFLCEGPRRKFRDDRGAVGGQTATRSGGFVALPGHVV